MSIRSLLPRKRLAQDCRGLHLSRFSAQTTGVPILFEGLFRSTFEEVSVIEILGLSFFKALLRDSYTFLRRF